MDVGAISQCSVTVFNTAWAPFTAMTTLPSLDNSREGSSVLAPSVRGYSQSMICPRSLSRDLMVAGACGGGEMFCHGDQEAERGTPVLTQVFPFPLLIPSRPPASAMAPPTFGVGLPRCVVSCMLQQVKLGRCTQMSVNA